MGRRISVVGISGNGKTTLTKRLARQLDVPRIELDALYHLPDWQEESAERFRDHVAAATAGDAWVVDGSYGALLGDIVFKHADTVVWLDQPLPLVLWRLVRRVIRDVRTRRDLFNGNRQTWRLAFFTRDSLLTWAIKSHLRRNTLYPEQFAVVPNLNVVRLRSRRAVERWLAAQTGD